MFKYFSSILEVRRIDGVVATRLVIPVYFKVVGDSSLQKTRFFGFTLAEIQSAFPNLDLCIEDNADNNYLNNAPARIVTCQDTLIDILTKLDNESSALSY